MVISRLLARLREFFTVRTVQLCMHCNRRTAGFWVSDQGGSVRRPWCGICIATLNLAPDRARIRITPMEHE